MVKTEKLRYRLKNRERINARRRQTNKRKRLATAANVKRRLTEAGAILDDVTDTELVRYSDYLVYALIDPRTIAVRYVGVSSTGLGRPRCHGMESALARGDNKRKDDWIRELHAIGLNYSIRVLEYFASPEAAHAAEPYWIAWMRSQGEHLYNQTAGDDTKIRASEETRAKMRQRMLGRVITWGDKISRTKRARR